MLCPKCAYDAGNARFCSQCGTSFDGTLRAKGRFLPFVIAGGAVLDPKGRPLRYNQRDTLLNGDFLALGDPALPWRDWMDA